MKWFDYAAPAIGGRGGRSAGAHPSARLLAGGTDLLVQLRAGRKETDLVIDVKRIPELNDIALRSRRAGLTLGAAVPCYRIYGDATVSAGLIRRSPRSPRSSAARRFRAARRSAAISATPRPAPIPIPLLIALGATCRIAGPGGTRDIAVEDFCIAPGTQRRCSRVNCWSRSISRRRVRTPARTTCASSRATKWTSRSPAPASESCSTTASFRSARIALASVAPTPLFVREAGRCAGRQARECRVSIAAAAEMAQSRGQAHHRHARHRRVPPPSVRRAHAARARSRRSQSPGRPLIMHERKFTSTPRSTASRRSFSASRARACSNACATSSASPAPRKAATTATAAPAP